MREFQNILFVSHGIRDETEGLKQALSLVSTNQAALKVLIIGQDLPDSHKEYKKSYEDFLKEQLNKSIQTLQSQSIIKYKTLNMSIEVEFGAVPAIRIIQHVLRNAHDLVIKEAELKDNDKGFEALDMALLRKCPCPLWICRPIKHSGNDIKIAVAIDPENEEQVGRDLAIRLLQISRKLADHYSGELIIISCWIYQLEEYLHNHLYNMVSQKELKRIVIDTQSEHLLSLETLIKEANIGNRYKIQHVKGRLEDVLHKNIERNLIDVLVMGTVARTGIPGFIIGNTAENVFQQLSCSLLALKPLGYVSPVSAY